MVLIGDNNFILINTLVMFTAYNQKIGPVQSNTLAVKLGIYDNEPLGQQDSATQLVLVEPNNWNPVIESVVLTIPYFVLH
jgi:hypothetical protein